MVFKYKNTTRTLLLFGSLLVCFFVQAQAKFYAKGNSTAYLGTHYQVSFVMENFKGENFMPPDFVGFQVAGAPSQSSNYQWINGKTSSSLTITYYLLPLDTGLATINSAKVQVEGKTLLTEEINVEVKKGNQPPNNQTANSSTQSSTKNLDWQSQAAEGIFIRLYTDNEKPYVGEQIIVQAKLYQRIEAYGTRVVDFPEFEGFWKQDVSPKEAEWKQEEYNGQNYHTVLAGKFVLFPQKNGEFTIEPYTLSTVLQIPKQSNSRDFWSQFFVEYEDVEYDFSSNSLLIDVKNLPEENKPATFTGAVGKFNLDATIDSAVIQLGSPININYKLKGTGNIMMANLPVVDFPKNIEVYDPDIDEAISEQSVYVNGKKEYKYIIVPELPGEYTLPSIDFSYFHPGDERYYTLSTDSFHISVEGEMPQAYLDSIEKEEKILAKGEMYPILKTLGEGDTKSQYYGTPLFYGLAGLPPVLFLLLLFLRKRIQEYTPDIIALKYKKAQKQATKRLKTARIFMQNGEKEPFYNEVINTLWTYCADKLHIDMTHLTKDNIARKLNEVGVSEESQNQMKSLLEKCEFALFATAAQSEMESDYNSANEVIVNIENEINA